MAKLEWLPIETYPTERVPKHGPDFDLWGPEVLVLTPASKSHIIIKGVPQPEFDVPPQCYVAHLEADMWLVRCENDPCAWGHLYAKPTHWISILDLKEQGDE